MVGSDANDFWMHLMNSWMQIQRRNGPQARCCWPNGNNRRISQRNQRISQHTSLGKATVFGKKSAKERSFQFNQSVTFQANLIRNGMCIIISQNEKQAFFLSDLLANKLHLHDIQMFKRRSFL